MGRRLALNPANAAQKNPAAFAAVGREAGRTPGSAGAACQTPRDFSAPPAPTVSN